MKNERSGASLFLLEMLLSLLIFALCAAVCTRLFSTSLKITRDTANYTSAVQIAQSIAEQCQNGVSPRMIANTWNAFGEPDEQGEYTVFLSAKGISYGLTDAVISVKNSEGKILYTLDFSYKEIRP